MVAYFALLSFVPLTFLALALLGLAHRADASDFLVKELSRAFPGTSLSSILKLLHEVQDNAATLGIIGGVALLWSSLSLFSALESAFNIVYGLPNRSFLRGKALAATLMIATITLLFVSLLVGSLGVEVLKRYAPGFVANAVVAYIVSIAVSLLGVFLFLFAVYWLLPTADVGPQRRAARRAARGDPARGVVPGPAGVRPPRRRQPDAARARRPGDPAALAVRDGERDRVRRRAELVAVGARCGYVAPSRRSRASRNARAERARCECSFFHASPSSPTVFVSPSGMKIGS